jgi:hypothetical protein
MRQWRERPLEIGWSSRSRTIDQDDARDDARKYRARRALINHRQAAQARPDLDWARAEADSATQARGWTRRAPPQWPARTPPRGYRYFN